VRNRLYFLVGLQPISGPGHLIVEDSRSHTIRHTDSKICLNDLSASHGGRYLQNTQQRQKTSSHTLSRIRTRNPSKCVVADQSLRPPATGIGMELTKFYIFFLFAVPSFFPKFAYRNLEMFIVWEQGIFGNISQNASSPGVTGLFPGAELAETWKWTFCSISYRDYECMVLYVDSPIHSHGLHRDKRGRSNTSFVVQHNFAVVTNDF